MPSDAELRIDPALWHADTLAGRLAEHFSDVVPWQAFLEFVADKRAAGVEVTVIGFRRQFDRYGVPVLLVDLVWRGEATRWRFPLLGHFIDPLDSQKYLVFNARLPRIALNVGYAMAGEIYFGLSGPAAAGERAD